MKKRFLYFFFTSGVLTLLLLGCFFAFYLSHVRFSSPIDIDLKGLNEEQLRSVKIFGITPLGRKSAIDISLLKKTSNKTLLFSDILIDFDKIPLDSLSEIRIQNCCRANKIGKSEIDRWSANNKIQTLFSVGQHIRDHQNTVAKLGCLRHLDWNAFVIAVAFYIKLSSFSKPFIMSAITLSLLFALLLFFLKRGAKAKVLSFEPKRLSQVSTFIFLLTVLIIIVSSPGQVQISAVETYIHSAFRSFLHFFSLSIPFVLLTVILPLSGILWSLFKKPISEQRSVFIPTGTAKGVFFICLSVFLIIQLYCNYYYKLRLQSFDATYDLLYYTYGDIYHAEVPTQTLRFICILNKIFLIPCYILHFPLDIIGRVYCLNDMCFHLFIGLSIVYLTQRYDLAALSLAGPLLVGDANNFVITAELFQSGSIMLLYVAVYQGLKDGALKKWILFPCLFFIIWGHPIAIFMLVAFLMGMYKAPAQLINDRWILSFILLNMLLKFLSFSGYDRANLAEFAGHADFHHFINLIAVYGIAYWYIPLIAIVGLYISLTRHQKISGYAGLLLAPPILYLALTRKPDIEVVDLFKYAYPINFLILVQGTVLITKYCDKYKKLIWVFTCIILLSGLLGSMRYYPYFMKRWILTEKMTSLCQKQDPNQSKWYICNDSLNKIGVFRSYDSNVEFITSSELNRLPVTVQLVIGSSDEKQILDTISEDRYYGYDIIKNFNKETSINNASSPLSGFDPYYFHFKKGPYKELILDTATLRMIKGSFQ